ncbi:MAG: uracil-DNA glycosylase [Erysipelotrichaceae bacterium]|nr:uracil-DNA glycosylase [Erysipelotrichaceae bacterium]
MFQNGWTQFLKFEFEKPYFKELSSFLTHQYSTKTIYPKKEDVFSSFGYTDYDDLKVVILGQDPYHQPNQAHGMCFSVKPKIPFPPSLHNIFKEYCNDLNLPLPESGYLVPWAKEGVLLLNTVLTVEEGKPNSHQNKGWEIFTDEVLKRCNQHPLPVVFVLWGRNAQMKESLIFNERHLIVKAPHPSPLSAYHGFFGSRPFSKSNDFLIKNDRSPVNWRL